MLSHQHVLVPWMMVWSDLRGERTGCKDIAQWKTDSHVAVGVDTTVFLHILHLCWVNMLNLLNSLGLAKHITRVGNEWLSIIKWDNTLSCDIKAWGQVQWANIRGEHQHTNAHRQDGCTCCWTGTCWVEPGGWTGTVVCRGTVEVESAPASGVCMAPKQTQRKQSKCDEECCWKTDVIFTMSKWLHSDDTVTQSIK